MGEHVFLEYTVFQVDMSYESICLKGGHVCVCVWLCVSVVCVQECVCVNVYLVPAL